MRWKVPHLKEDEQAKVEELFKNTTIIAHSLNDLSPCSVPTTYNIDLTDYTPIASKVKRENPRFDQQVYEQFMSMSEAGVITRSTSPWAFPLVTVPKPDGSLWLCVNFKPLTNRMHKDSYPLPNIDEILETLAGRCYFSTLDIFSGYWQIRLTDGCKELTTLRCKFGMFEFEVLPFELKNASAVFLRLMSQMLEDLSFVRIYIDDIITFSMTFEEHLKHVDIVLWRLREHGLKLRLSKCLLVRDRDKILGHCVSREGNSIVKSKIRNTFT